jgi:hypothetical protein
MQNVKKIHCSTYVSRLIRLITGVVSVMTANSNSIAGEIELRSEGPLETVYEWKTEKCDDLFIPDSPARAYRRNDGSIVLIAAHYHNQVMVGPTFDRLKPRCDVSSSASEDPNPASFDTRFWIQAFLPGTNNQIIGIVSHEYSGARFGNCATAKGPTGICWYSSILETEANESQLHFRLPSSLETRIVAAPPRPFDRARTSRYGFITTSNSFIRGEYAYIYVWGEFGGNKVGNCLFRAPLSAIQGNWIAYYGGSFSQRFANPYDAKSAAPNCDPIAPGQLKGQLRSVVQIDDQLIGVFDMQSNDVNQAGVYYATSFDMVTWSEPKILYHARPWYGATGCGLFYGYPSLIDHDSPSKIFDRGSKDLHLYLTRMNWADCNKGLDRDLVRIRLKAVKH